VTVSASPDIGATFEVSGHVIPQVDIGLSALSVVSTSVFLKLDASADFIVSTDAGASAGTSPQSCVSVSTDINVGVGAQGSFFGLFHASESKSLFDKEFPLFQVRSYEILEFFFSPPPPLNRAYHRNVSHQQIRVRRRRPLP
jgi:hypothetical protein